MKIKELENKILELEKENFALKKVIEEYRNNQIYMYRQEYIPIPYLYYVPNINTNPYPKPYEIYC